jgi:hypothetical protein
MAIYGDGSFYNGGIFYGPSDVDILINLSFYRTSLDGIYVFHWGFSPAIISPDLFIFDYELQLDVVPTFDSPQLVSFLSASVITYQNGNVRKGYAVPVAARIDKIEQVWYARVRIVDGMVLGPWSATLVWTIPVKMQQQFAENIMTSLPDEHVYGKGDLLKPVNQRNSNLYVVDDMYGNQLDAAFYENFLTQTDNLIDLCRDEFLQPNFGVLFNFVKPTSMTFVDYRWILKQLMLASLEGSTNDAVSRVVAAFTGVSPNLINVRDRNDFFLNTIQDNPIVPGGPQTLFNTSYPFVPGTLAVEDLTTGLFVPSSNYVTNPTQGTWTMNVATTDTLQATFNVGTINDPFPVIFNGLDYTVLSGTATFTNGSDLVTGVGTFFSAQLLVGDQITDVKGVYIGTVSIITDNTHLTLVQPWFGSTETVGIFKLKYTDIQLPPPINWAKETLAWGLIIEVLNPGEFLLNNSLVEAIGSGVLPAFVKTYWEFPS